LRQNNSQLAVNQFDTLTEALIDLHKRDFTYSFNIEEEGARCIETGEVFKPEDITIEEYHRFEGESNPDDMSVVYAVKTKSGLKGTFIDAYGTYSNPHTARFLKRVNFREKDIAGS
jgi:hypothetical protein